MCRLTQGGFRTFSGGPVSDCCHNAGGWLTFYLKYLNLRKHIWVALNRDHTSLLHGHIKDAVKKPHPVSNMWETGSGFGLSISARHIISTLLIGLLSAIYSAAVVHWLTLYYIVTSRYRIQPLNTENQMISGGMGSLKECVKKHKHTGTIKTAVKTSQPFNNKLGHPQHKPTAKPCQTKLKVYPVLSACCFAVAGTLLSACQPLFTFAISSVQKTYWGLYGYS